MKGKTKQLKKQLKRVSDNLSEVLKDRSTPNRQTLIHQLYAQSQDLNAQLNSIGKVKSIAPTERMDWESDRHLRKINEVFTKKPENRLKCPKCGEPDHDNVVNGKPFCTKCMIPLDSKKTYYSPPPDWRRSATFKPVV
jgi:formylmethanofuran dehydrogenase subunit E